MRLEKLKTNKRKNVIIGLLLGLTIISSLILSISLAKFKNIESIPLAKGTINYSGADFSMVAIKISDDKENYTDSKSVPTEGYKLNTDRSNCKVGDTKQDIEIVYDKGKINFLGMTTGNTKCNLYFDKSVGTDFILANIKDNVTEQTSSVPNFASAATGNEGVFKTSDGMYGGDTYYWRGAVDNNHVIFANHCWKIIRINGDGSIRVIYNGTPTDGVCKQVSDATSIAIAKQQYSPNYDYSYYVGWTYEAGKQRPTNNDTASPSNIKTQTNTWYEDNITKKGYDAQVATGKFCNDRNTGAGYTWAQNGNTFYYAGYDRSGAKNASSVTPVTTCPEGDVYEMKAGIITMDEIVMAGGKWGTANSSYFLYNNQYYWTLSPSYWYKGNYYAIVFSVYNDGRLDANFYMYGDTGVRPVINLRSDTVFASGGKGTSTSPYVVF